ncbi:MAG: DNA recombination/repair protein RecA, partial [Bacillota bacterium]
LEVRKIESLKQGGDVVGNRTRVKVVKNKVSPPFRQADFDIMYGTGISREGTLLDIAADLNIISKSGAWYSYRDERLGQGRENVKEMLKDRSDLLNEIERKVREHFNLRGGQDRLEDAGEV